MEMNFIDCKCKHPQTAVYNHGWNCSVQIMVYLFTDGYLKPVITIILAERQVQTVNDLESKKKSIEYISDAAEIFYDWLQSHA